MSHLAEQPDDERNQPDFTPAREACRRIVLALNGRGVAGRGVVTPFLDRAQAKDGIRNAPSFLYSEDRPGAIFGFYHIEALTARSNPEERQAGLHRHPDFDQLLILATGTCLFEHDGQKREVEAPCCVYTPANVVHRFFYPPDATGVVISVSSDFVAGLSSAEHQRSRRCFVSAPSASSNSGLTRPPPLRGR